MIKCITDYLDYVVKEHGNKLAYCDENKKITFKELYDSSRKIAYSLVQSVKMGQAVIVYMDKCVESIETFLGVNYIGAFYVPIDVHMPYQRVQLILDVLKASVIVTRINEKLPEKIIDSYHILYYEELTNQSSIEEKLLEDRHRRIIDMDPMYAIFTSGSTGLPKGVLVSHRSAINFTEWWCETFEFSSEEIFANQTPFYFDGSVKDIYATLRCGATMHIVPKKLFSILQTSLYNQSFPRGNCHCRTAL